MENLNPKSRNLELAGNVHMHSSVMPVDKAKAEPTPYITQQLLRLDVEATAAESRAEVVQALPQNSASGAHRAPLQFWNRRL
jgi:hypothetical protein